MLDPRTNNLPTAFANSTDRPKVIIGSGNIHRPQRYAHKDPAPWLAFPDDTTRVDPLELIYFAVIAIVFLAFIGVITYVY